MSGRSLENKISKVSIIATIQRRYSMMLTFQIFVACNWK